MKAFRTSSKPAVTAAVLRLLQGCSVENLVWLCRGAEIYDNIYVVEPDGNFVRVAGASGFSAWTPEEGELPWTVALLLGSHSRKHILF